MPTTRANVEQRLRAVESIDAGALDTLIDWRHKAPAPELAYADDDGAHVRVFLVALGIASAHGTLRARYPVVGFESSLSTRCIELGSS